MEFLLRRLNVHLSQLRILLSKIKKMIIEMYNIEISILVLLLRVKFLKKFNI